MPHRTISKVIHLIPDFAADHPYNMQLISALRASGVHLKTIRTKSFLKSVFKFPAPYTAYSLAAFFHKNR